MKIQASFWNFWEVFQWHRQHQTNRHLSAICLVVGTAPIVAGTHRTHSLKATNALMVVLVVATCYLFTMMTWHVVNGMKWWCSTVSAMTWHRTTGCPYCHGICGAIRWNVMLRSNVFRRGTIAGSVSKMWSASPVHGPVDYLCGRTWSSPTYLG